MSCHPSSSSNSKKPGGTGGITIALAGNANVGKSVLFNQLTGSSQIIGNWPGKTVERAEGTLKFEGEEITAIDLPGIYSFSTFGMEELVSREYIALEHLDVVINVVDASILERNLFFTLQLIEMNAPLVVCLNQVDEAKKKGITIDKEKLEQILGVPVVPTVGIRGEGVYDLTKTAVTVAKNGGCTNSTSNSRRADVRYGAEIEERIGSLDKEVAAGELGLEYPSRWVAIKLLENDPEIKKIVGAKSESIVKAADNLASEISAIHNEPCFSVIASERYALASRIANEVQQVESRVETTFSEKLEWVTTHRMFGYLTSAGVIAGLLLWTFSVGGLLSNVFSNALALFSPVDPKLSGSVEGIIWNGVYGGFVSGVTLVIPYVVPFYIMLAIIEDSGVLTRVAFMMDSAMHKIGLHGKALIPMILGYGCNVPAIAACRIMETKRERLLATYVITFAPCAARTIVILGLVAAFVNPWWALALYAIDIALIFVMGRVALRVVPGQSTGLIMEMHSFKIPSLTVVTKQTWIRTKSLIYLVFPLYIIGSAGIQVLYALGVLQYLSNAFTPVTVVWLGLPAIAGVLMILGLIRKELTLLGAVAIFGTTNLAPYFTPVQLIVLALTSIIFIPCISTVTILAKDFGWKTAATIATANFATAILVGGVAFRLLTLII
ncbi:MAG: ferrous iron transport protein B [Thaumarchaeota archaeon]|nr:ferrous iron transport protein B [Nitrososphaerota archaeon]MCL5319042.1 ferrous iron transport protein B [Nitrososphaerota archaeon]